MSVLPSVSAKLAGVSAPREPLYSLIIAHMIKKLNRITDVRPQARNLNRHTARGLGALEKSIQADGWIGAITVAADGETFDWSARIETGAAAGFDDAIVVRSDGSKPVIHIREDIATADDPRAVRLSVAAN